MKKLILMLSLTSCCHSSLPEINVDDSVEYIEYDVKDGMEGIYYHTKTKMVELQKELRKERSHEIHVKILGSLEAYADILEYIITHD